MELDGRVRGNRPRIGKFSEKREVWVKLGTWEYILERSPASDNDPLGGMWLKLRRVGQKRETIIPMHAMTVPELDALTEFMGHAMERARPFCEGYDNEAEEARKEGDDSFARLYRPIPRVVVRERS